jgi:hypothetical protein
MTWNVEIAADFMTFSAEGNDVKKSLALIETVFEVFLAERKLDFDSEDDLNTVNTGLSVNS